MGTSGDIFLKPTHYFTFLVHDPEMCPLFPPTLTLSRSLFLCGSVSPFVRRKIYRSRVRAVICHDSRLIVGAHRARSWPTNQLKLWRVREKEREGGGEGSGKWTCHLVGMVATWSSLAVPLSMCVRFA